MLNFAFDEEREVIRQTVSKFCTNQVAPYLTQIDGDGKIPQSIIQGLAKLGLLGMTVSKEYGGSEIDPITAGIVAEELARADLSCAVPTFFLVQAAWGYVLDRYGTGEVKAQILPAVTAGRAFLGIATTEPDVGSDLANMKTIAKKTTGKYRIKGEKMFISGIDEVWQQMPDGGGYITLVKTDPSKGTRGMSLFYIPIRQRGVSVTRIEEWGRRGISSGGFALDEVELGEEYLIGEENKGFYIAMEGFDYARALISLVCCGAATACIEQAMDYIKARRVFGQPIARYEGVQFKLAEHWAKIDAIRLLGYKALWAYGKEHDDGSIERFEVSRLCAEAKMLAPAVAFDAINDAIQWFGAFGYTTDCPLHLALKGIRSYFWAEGALEIMKIIVARELLGKEYVAYR